MQKAEHSGNLYALYLWVKLTDCFSCKKKEFGTTCARCLFFND